MDKSHFRPWSKRMLLLVLAISLAMANSLLPVRNSQPSLAAAPRAVGDLPFHTYLPLISQGASTQSTIQPDDPVDGSLANCTDFILSIVGIDINIPDPGWVWVNPAQKFRDVTGVAEGSEVSHTDFPAVHDSHDQNTDILVDPGQDNVLSDVNRPNNEDPVADPSELLPPTSIEMEWEIGTFPTETSAHAPERFFPKWAWPNEGDRVWANGHWIFDCGHGKDVAGVTHHRTEIHPARAIASMRDQVRVLPGTGTTPVPVTATDLYIHGRAGFVVDVLNCGMDIIIDANPDACATKTTPIDDNFEFDILLPPKPSPTAVLATFMENGPGNSIGIAPILTPTPAGNPTALHVSIPLEGSGVSPNDVYARRIYVGWVFPPDPPLRHFKLTLNQMDLHEDHETDPGDCECTFFWMNVDRSPANEWIRLVDFATGDMNDYDDDGGLGDGEMNFTGATFDFHVRDGQSFNVRANGYDQDCLDDYFGDHHFVISTFLDCYFLAGIELNPGDNDEFASLSATFGPPDYGVGAQDVTANGEYELEFTIEEIPLTAGEDSADLRLTKICKPDDVGLAGQPITCTIFVDNLGPGLPRNVVVHDTLLTNVAPDSYTIITPTFTFSGGPTVGTPCNLAPPNQFTCQLATVPIGGRATIVSVIIPDEGGDYNNEAHVSTDSTDPNPANNQAVDGLTVNPVADLVITQVDTPDPVSAGTRLTYTLSITNQGPSTATNVVVEDLLPAEVSAVSVSGSGGASCHFGVPGDPTRPTVCAFGSLAPASTATMIIVVNVDPGIARVIHNDARVYSTALDPNNASNLSSESTTVTVADLKIVKTSDADIYSPSSTVRYTIAVQNIGPSDAANVVVIDHLPDVKQANYVFDTGGCTKSGLTLTCSVGSVPAGTTVTFNVYVRVNGSKGQIVNIASVTSSAFDPVLSNNSSTRVVLIKGGIH